MIATVFPRLRGSAKITPMGTPGEVLGLKIIHTNNRMSVKMSQKYKLRYLRHVRAWLLMF